jgi:hypothetical protein
MKSRLTYLSVLFMMLFSLQVHICFAENEISEIQIPYKINPEFHDEGTDTLTVTLDYETLTGYAYDCAIKINDTRYKYDGLHLVDIWKSDSISFTTYDIPENMSVVLMRFAVFGSTYGAEKYVLLYFDGLYWHSMICPFNYPGVDIEKTDRGELIFTEFGYDRDQEMIVPVARYKFLGGDFYRIGNAVAREILILDSTHRAQGMRYDSNGHSYFKSFKQQDTLMIYKYKKSLTKNTTGQIYPWLMEKSCFSDTNIQYKVRYAMNGWQVYDSVAYGDGKITVFQAKYPEPVLKDNYPVLSKTIESYKISSVDSCSGCYQEQSTFFRVVNQYGLLNSAIFRLNLVLKNGPVRQNNKYVFNTGNIPSILLGFGIPYDEVLTSFKFEIRDSLLISDSYNFENYQVDNTYFYEDSVLQKRNIVVKYLNESNEKHYCEYFVFE